MENVHSGHRERLKSRFSQHGLEAFSDIEALEILLYYALPRRDTNVIAHRLLERFGSYCAVLEADVSELSQVSGVGDKAASLIRLVAEMNRRYLTARENRGRRLIHSGDDAGEHVLPLFAYRSEELVFAFSLGSAGNILRCHRLAQGMSNAVDFPIRRVVEIALQDNACYILLAHNHLSDTALPSKSDLSTTEAVADALRYVGVRLYDHIIVCGGDYVSLRDSGYFGEK